MRTLSSLYEHPFHKSHLCPQGITYNACPRALGGLCQPRNICQMIFESFFLITISKFVSDGFLEKERGVASCPLISYYP